MLLIETLYTGDAAPTARLTLDFDARTKSRLRTQLADGEEVGLFLPRGTILRGGDRLQAADGRLMTVKPAVSLETVFFKILEGEQTAPASGPR